MEDIPSKAFLQCWHPQNNQAIPSFGTMFTTRMGAIFHSWITPELLNTLTTSMLRQAGMLLGGAWKQRFTLVGWVSYDNETSMRI